MKKLLLSLCTLTALTFTASAQRYTIDNTSPCNVYVTYYWFAQGSGGVPAGNSVPYYIPAGTMMTTSASISSIAWKGGGPGCGMQIGFSISEGPACGATPNAISWHGDPGQPNYVTSCTNAAGCPVGTMVGTSAGYSNVFTGPIVGPTLQPCEAIEFPAWDAQLSIN